MRSILAAPLAIVLSLAAGTPTIAAITSAEAAGQVGQSVTVEAVVSGVVHPGSSGITLINLDGAYPNELLTVVVYGKDATKFSDLDALSGAAIDVTGTVSNYKGHPEIVVSDPGQLIRK